MNVIAFDTATELLSVALQTDRGNYCLEIDAGLSHSERLQASADSLLALAGLETTQIDLIACMRGPGSFTGLRIGMAAAKGLSVALDRPLIAVSTLDCVAAAWTAWPGSVLALIDAKHERWFGAIYKRGVRLCADFDESAATIAQRFKDSDTIHICGPDAEKAVGAFTAVMGENRVSASPTSRRGSAPFLAALAEARYKTRASGEEENIGPDYIRLSDAELNLIKRSNNA